MEQLLPLTWMGPMCEQALQAFKIAEKIDLQLACKLLSFAYKYTQVKEGYIPYTESHGSLY